MTSFDANIVAKILRGGKNFFKQGKVAHVTNNLREVICLAKNFFNAVGTRGEKFLREDGFFFVTLLILNTPIISFTENFQVGFVKFYLGALAIFLVALAINFLLQPLPRVKKFIQAVVIILFAVHFVTDIFLLYKFGVPLNMDMWQILLATNFAEAQTFLREQVLSVKIILGVVLFVLMMCAMIFALKKFFETRSTERLKRFVAELSIIFFLPMIISCRIIFEQPTTFVKAIFLNTTIGLSVREIDELVETAPIGDESKIFAEMGRQLATEKILDDKSDIPFVIFVLGESTDRNHMQLYGYNLPTTPHLTECFERGEIFLQLTNDVAQSFARRKFVVDKNNFGRRLNQRGKIFGEKFLFGRVAVLLQKFDEVAR